MKWGERVNANLKDAIFNEIENAPVFSSKERLEKLLIVTCGNSRPMKKIVKMIAKDAQKAYMLGIETGEAGQSSIPFVGLDDVAATFKNADMGREITKFIYQAYACGYVVGSTKNKALKEVTGE